MSFQALDTILGLVFMYLLLSLACTMLNELIAQWMHSRSDTLQEGLRKLFTGRSSAPKKNDDTQAAQTLLERFNDHQIICALRQKRRRSFALLSTEDSASYIPVTAFSTAFFDVVAPGVTTRAELMEKIPALPPQISQALRAFVNEGGDLADVQLRVQRWYQDVMERVSGLYKRRAQLRILVLAAFISVGANADTIRIARALGESAVLRAVIVAQAEALATLPPETLGIVRPSTAPASGSAEVESAATPNAGAVPSGRPAEGPLPAPNTSDPVKRAASALPTVRRAAADSAAADAAARHLAMIRHTLDSLNTLGVPLGWPPLPRAVRDRIDAGTGWVPRWVRVATHRGGDVVTSLPGLLLTTLAVSLGAPFWFDMLNKVINIRSAGRAPEEDPKAPQRAPPARGAQP